MMQDNKNKRIIGNGCSPDIRAALSGPCPSVRTPFNNHGNIDFDGLHSQVQWMLDAKARVVVLTYGDSLFSVLSDDEISEITRAVIEQAKGRAQVVAATGTWWTGKTRDFAKHTKELGADMLMVLPPDWTASTTVESLVSHYAAAAEYLPVMVVTNFLKNRPMAFGLELIKTLMEQVPGVIALKDDIGGGFARRACLLSHDQWAIIAGGQKKNHLNMLPYGVDGYFSAHMSFAPDIAWRYWQAIKDYDIEQAKNIIAQWDMPLFDHLIKYPGGFDAAIHGILEWRGLSKRYRRPPYHTLTDKQMEELEVFISTKYAVSNNNE